MTALSGRANDTSKKKTSKERFEEARVLYNELQARNAEAPFPAAPTESLRERIYRHRRWRSAFDRHFLPVFAALRVESAFQTREQRIEDQKCPAHLSNLAAHSRQVTGQRERGVEPSAAATSTRYT